MFCVYKVKRQYSNRYVVNKAQSNYPQVITSVLSVAGHYVPST